MEVTYRGLARRESRRALIVAAFVIGVFCLFASLSRRDMNRLAALRARGVESRGTITERWQNTRGGRRAFGIHYRFEADGRSFAGQWPVSEAYHARAAVGALVLVTYLPADPENHYVGRVDDALLAQRRANQYAGLGAAGAVSAALLFLLGRRSRDGRRTAL